MYTSPLWSTSRWCLCHSHVFEDYERTGTESCFLVVMPRDAHFPGEKCIVRQQLVWMCDSESVCTALVTATSRQGPLRKTPLGNILSATSETFLGMPSVAVQRTFNATGYHGLMLRFGMNGWFEFGSANFLDPFEPPLPSLEIHHHTHIFLTALVWSHD
jgi:hypothetical protein